MSLNWLRAWSLSVSDGLSISSDDEPALRVVWSIEQGSNQSPNMASFRIYNLAPTTVATLQGLVPARPTDGGGAQITFSAGYQDNSGPVFMGEAKQVISGHDNAVDSYVEIFCADGHTAYNSAVVRQSLAAGYTPQDKIQAAVSAMGQYGVTMGPSNLNLSSPSFPRGAVLSGMARDVIRQTALSAGGLWYILNGQVNLVDPTQPGQNGAINLGPSTGLVGWPKQTYQGIYTTSLVNPALVPGCQITLDPSLIQAAALNLNYQDPNAIASNQFLQNMALGAGIYNVFYLSRKGDTRGNEWYDEVLSIGVGGSAPKSVTDAGYGQYIVGH